MRISKEPREDDDPLSRAVQRMAGRQDEPRIANVPRHPHSARRDDLRAFHAIHEGVVGRLETDLITTGQVVEPPERSRVRGPVTRHGDGPALTGHRRAGIVARTPFRSDPASLPFTMAASMPTSEATMRPTAPPTRVRRLARLARNAILWSSRSIRRSSRRSEAFDASRMVGSSRSSERCDTLAHSADTGSCQATVKAASARSRTPLMIDPVETERHPAHLVVLARRQPASGVAVIPLNVIRLSGTVRPSHRTGRSPGRRARSGGRTRACRGIGTRREP